MTTNNLPLSSRKLQVSSVREVDDVLEIDVVWTTGALVRRYSYENQEFYDEELVMDSGSIRLQRLESGSAPVLNSHQSWNLDDVIGAVKEGTVRIENGQGFATLRLDAGDENSSLKRKVKNGIVRNISVGYVTHKREIIRGGEVPIYRAIDWEPYEISLVPVPADAQAGVRSENVTTFPCETIHRTALTPSTTEEESMNQTTPSAAAVTTPSATPEIIAAAAVQAENARVQAIRSLIEQTNASHPGLSSELRTIETVAIGDTGTNIDAVRAKVLDALTKTPAQTETIHTTVRVGEEDTQKMARAIESAQLHRYDPKTFKLENGAEDFRGYSLVETGRELLARQGHKVRGLSKMEIADLMLSRAGAHTTGDFPSILANIANKTVRVAYEAAPRTFTAWARQVSSPDFKTNSRIQLSDAPALEKVGQNGEFAYGSFSDSQESYKVETYGKIVSITRQAIINDDQSLFTRVPAALAASSAALESDIVYNILKNNPNLSDGVALFAAGHKNLGTGGAISVTTLAELYRLMFTQTGPNGTVLNLQPAFLIVPSARMAEGKNFLTASNVIAAKAADNNPFAGTMQLVVEGRLDGVSQNPWYVAADPSRVDTIEYCYLEGQVGAYIETKLGFNTDGVEIKVRNDFAAAPIDHRGLARNPGV